MYDHGLETADEMREAEKRGEFIPLKYSAETDRRGREHVGVMPVLEWKRFEPESEFLLEKCEGLYATFVKLESKETNGDGNGHANHRTDGHANGHAAQ